jgi:hypothetical protein
MFIIKFKNVYCMKRKQYFIRGFLSLLMASAAVSACKDDDPVGPPSLYAEYRDFAFSPMGETKEIELLSNTNEISIDREYTADWCEVSLSGKILTVTVSPNSTYLTRNTSVDVTIPGKFETLNFVQAGQPTAKFVVDTGYASSEQFSVDEKTGTRNGDLMIYSYDGRLGSAHYHSAWNMPEPNGTFELVYKLKPNTNLSLLAIAYYARPKKDDGTLFSNGYALANGTFGKVDVLTSTDGISFTMAKKDYVIGNPKTKIHSTYPLPAYITLEEPAANIAAVKIVVDGNTSVGNFASCSEMEFYGIGTSAEVAPYIELSQSSCNFDYKGGAAGINVVTNATSITASSDAGWCSVSVNGRFVSVSVPENSSEADSRYANITIASANGLTATVPVFQLRNVPDASKELEVDLASAESYADSYFPGTGNEGPYELMFDEDYETHWHSSYGDDTDPQYGPKTGPHNLYFHLKSPSTLSYIIYYPRNYPDGGNGNWGQVKVYVKRGGSWEYQITYDCEGKGGLSKIVLPSAVDNVTDVRIEITQQPNSSCSEIRFFN